MCSIVLFDPGHDGRVCLTWWVTVRSPGGWSAPPAWGSAEEEDASPPTRPHPGTRHHPPLLQTQRGTSIQTGEQVCVCVCVRIRRRGKTRRQLLNLSAAGDTSRLTKFITSKIWRDFYSLWKRDESERERERERQRGLRRKIKLSKQRCISSVRVTGAQRNTSQHTLVCIGTKDMRQSQSKITPPPPPHPHLLLQP